MNDSTETARRRQRIVEIAREEIHATRIQQWTAKQLIKDFSIIGFRAPYVYVKRRSDGEIGSLEFNHSPRVYFNWTPE